jgi:hypothetical protein
MRFSIVIDDDETIFAATAGDEDTDAPVSGPGERIGHFDIPGDMEDAELHQRVNRVLTDMDASSLTHLPTRREAENSPH